MKDFPIELNDSKFNPDQAGEAAEDAKEEESKEEEAEEKKEESGKEEGTKSEK